IPVVNADGGIYWRAATDWNTGIQRTGYGVYTGDRVQLTCWKRGGVVPPLNNNPLWYQATVISGQGKGSGYVNDHFLDTGINVPSVSLPGAPRAGGGAPPPPPPPANTAPTITSVSGGTGVVGSDPTLQIAYVDPECNVTSGLWEGAAGSGLSASFSVS